MNEGGATAARFGGSSPAAATRSAPALASSCGKRSSTSETSMQRRLSAQSSRAATDRKPHEMRIARLVLRSRGYRSNDGIDCTGVTSGRQHQPSISHPMSTLLIEGGHRLSGRVHVEGNKNAALPLLAACLLTVRGMRADQHAAHSRRRGHGAAARRSRCGGRGHRHDHLSRALREIVKDEPDPALVGRLRGSVLLSVRCWPGAARAPGAAWRRLPRAPFALDPSRGAGVDGRANRAWRGSSPRGAGRLASDLDLSA